MMMVELWQAEWCPASRHVRQRLTELGIDYIARQVPIERDNRLLLRERTGNDSIPILVADREVIVGNDDLASIAAQVRAKLTAVVERAGRSA
jgi:glutaredoxin